MNVEVSIFDGCIYYLCADCESVLTKNGIGKNAFLEHPTTELDDYIFFYKERPSNCPFAGRRCEVPKFIYNLPNL